MLYELDLNIFYIIAKIANVVPVTLYSRVSMYVEIVVVEIVRNIIIVSKSTNLIFIFS